MQMTDTYTDKQHPVNRRGQQHHVCIINLNGCRIRAEGTFPAIMACLRALMHGKEQRAC